MKKNLLLVHLLMICCLYHLMGKTYIMYISGCEFKSQITLEEFSQEDPCFKIRF